MPGSLGIRAFSLVPCAPLLQATPARYNFIVGWVSHYVRAAPRAAVSSIHG
jgi:hypothetical protein